jgi:hypothetical protein
LTPPVVGADLRLYGRFLAALAATVFLAAALTLLPDTLTVAMMLIVCCVFGNEGLGKMLIVYNFVFREVVHELR